MALRQSMKGHFHLMAAGAVLLVALAWGGAARASHGEEAVAEYRAAMEKMHHAMPSSYIGDPDTDFAAGMIPHHQAAVEMAQTQLRHGESPLLRWLAGAIVQAQTAEIATMEQWLSRKGYLFEDADASSSQEYRESVEKMHAAMHGVAYEGDPDRDFALGMIPHHEGAVAMAGTLLKHGRTREMTDLARRVAHAQQGEITMMRRWLRHNPPTPSPTE